MLLRRHILPAAKRLGIQKRIGWHTYRRTAASLLMASGASVKVASGASVKVSQELLRHASADITLELYAQAIDADKRVAQNALSTLIVGQTIPPMQGTEAGISAS